MLTGVLQIAKASIFSGLNNLLCNDGLEEGEERFAFTKDEAFSFYYPESIRALEAKGAEVIEFSPLVDGRLPEVDGLILGGGFPEMFAEKLSANTSLIADIQEKTQLGMPILAECGGFMYLSQSLTDFAGVVYPMCGVLPCQVRMSSKLQMVGYVTAELLADGILGKKGDMIKGHEFHFSAEADSDNSLNRAFRFTRSRNGEQYYGGCSLNNVVGSYLHMHFAGYPTAAENFVKACLKYRKKD